jgi:hypothetical protein
LLALPLLAPRHALAVELFREHRVFKHPVLAVTPLLPGLLWTRPWRKC